MFTFTGYRIMTDKLSHAEYVRQLRSQRGAQPNIHTSTHTYIHIYIRVHTHGYIDIPTDTDRQTDGHPKTTSYITAGGRCKTCEFVKISSLIMFTIAMLSRIGLYEARETVKHPNT
jgi:hypothetical protein